ncbi:MAG: hypothetical protein JWM85_800 [Acidimicrobiaceae bacterium]|nr:hypothetical protein [Acidimicrobiaceae bacterium]
MRSAEVLLDGFGRVDETLQDLLKQPDETVLMHRPDPEANTVCWLVWHLLRVQDDHVAKAFGHEQAWTEEGWNDRFALDLPADDTGYGHSPGQVGAVRASASLLAGYADAVHQRTVSMLTGLDDAELDRVVDNRFQPPVTLGVRLVSVLSDDLQHLGQAAYLVGLAERSN